MYESPLLLTLRRSLPHCTQRLDRVIPLIPLRHILAFKHPLSFSRDHMELVFFFTFHHLENRRLFEVDKAMHDILASGALRVGHVIRQRLEHAIQLKIALLPRRVVSASFVHPAVLEHGHKFRVLSFCSLRSAANI